MSKTPDGKRIIKVLEILGFYIDRQKGSHVILKNEQSVMVVIPVHGSKELKLGLFKSILKDIKISEEEFWKVK